MRAGVIERWEYCGAKKTPLADDEVEIRDYSTFEGLYVRFDMGYMQGEKG